MYFHFLWKMKIDVVTSVCTGHSNMPPACCVPMGSNPSPQQNGSLFTSVPDAPSDPWILPRAKNMLSPACFCTSVRTGAALSNPVSSSANEKDHTQRCGLFHWQRMRDSNPRKRSQSPVCYRYTNPLYAWHGYYYTHATGKVKKFFPFFAEFFLAPEHRMPAPGEIIQK